MARISRNNSTESMSRSSSSPIHGDNSNGPIIDSGSTPTGTISAACIGMLPRKKHGRMGFYFLVIALYVSQVGWNWGSWAQSYISSATMTTRAISVANERKEPLPMEDPEKDSFAACLLIMDDNHQLIEWLAYHYHVLPLRRLIVHNDPEAKTSPLPILDRWADRINITVWNNTDLFATGKPPKKWKGVNQHRNRQKHFMQRCLETFHQEERHWVLFTDTDEFTMINPRAYNSSDPMYRYGIDIDTKKDKKDTTTTTNTAATTLPPFEVPQHQEPGSVVKLLQWMETHQPPDNKWFPSGEICLGITRKNFGTREYYRHHNETTPTTAGPSWNASHFKTFRWRFHQKGSPIGKMMVDLSRVNTSTVEKNYVPSPHKPMAKVCKNDNMWNGEKHNPFVLYHYSATLEQMLFRSGDKRGSEHNSDDNATAYRIARFHEEAGPAYNQVQAPTHIQAWLLAFVQTVGAEEAQRLLVHVGNPHRAAGWNDTTTTTATMEIPARDYQQLLKEIEEMSTRLESLKLRAKKLADNNMK